MSYPKAVYDKDLKTRLVRDESEEAEATQAGFGPHPSTQGKEEPASELASVAPNNPSDANKETAGIPVADANKRPGPRIPQPKAPQ